MSGTPAPYTGPDRRKFRFSLDVSLGQVLTIVSIVGSATASVFGAGAYVQTLRDNLAHATAEQATATRERTVADVNLTDQIRSLVKEQIAAAVQAKDATLQAKDATIAATAQAQRQAAATLAAARQQTTALHSLADQTGAVQQAVTAATPKPSKGWFER